MHERQHAEHNHESAQRRQGERGDELGEGNSARHTDQHVLRVAHRCHRASNIGPERDGEQERNGTRPSGRSAAITSGVRTRQIVSFTKNADRSPLVDHDAAASSDARRRRPTHDVPRRPLEESTDLEKPGDEQDAEEKHHDVEIDRRVRVLQRQTADRHHRHRTEQRGGRAIERSYGTR